MKTKVVSWLLTACFVLMCWAPAAAQGSDTVRVEVVSATVGQDGLYHITIEASVERDGAPAPAQDISFLLIGNKNNGLSGNDIQVTVNGQPQTAYIYHADMVNTAEDDVQNANEEHVYRWNLTAKLPEELLQSDYVYAFVGLADAPRTDIQVVLPNSYLTVQVEAQEKDFSIPAYVDAQTPGSHQIPFDVTVTHREEGEQDVPADQIVWSVESAGEVKEDLTGKVSVQGGILTIYSAAAVLQEKELTVKASYNGAVGSTHITLTQQQSAATYLMVQPPQPVQVPVSGVAYTQLYANVTDQYGVPIQQAEDISWTLEQETEGVSVNASTGQVTVNDTALAAMGETSQKEVNVVAQSGTLKAMATVLLTADRTPVAAAIQGPSVASVKDTAPSEFTVMVTDQYGTAYPPQQQVVWAISSGADMVQMETEGATARLLLMPGAQVGSTVVLTAKCGDFPEVKKNISIIEESPVPASVEITVQSGQNSIKPQITVPDPGSENAVCTWTARVLNQFGNPMNEYNQDIVWDIMGDGKQAVSIEKNQESSSVESTATISVSSEAFGLGKVTVRASYGNALGTQDLYLATIPVAGAVEIQGDSTILSRSNMAVSKAYTAKVYDQYGQSMLQSVQWSLKNALGGVSMRSDGVLQVAAGTSGSVTLLAVTQGKEGQVTAEKTVTIQLSSTGGSYGGGGGGGGAVIPVPDPTPTPQPQPQPQPERDIAQNHWAYPEIKQMMEDGLVKGDAGTGNIRPEDNILREEVAAVLLRALDVAEKPNAVLQPGDPSSEWAAGILAAAADAGIMKGIEDGIYAGQYQASRAEVMVMVARALGLENGDTTVLAQFTDGVQVPDWAAGSVSAMVQAGVVKGYEDGSLRTGQNITRAEAFVMIQRLLAI